MPQIRDLWKSAVEDGGFISSLDEIPNAFISIHYLEKYVGDVYAVTASPLIKNWHFERSQWLIEKMKIPYKRHIQASAKFMIHGDVLIDDKIENLEEYEKRNPQATLILFDQPWNKNCNRFKRACSWEQVIEIIESIK